MNKSTRWDVGSVLRVTRPVVPEGMKICIRCLSILPMTREHWKPDSRYLDGFHSYCRPCHRADNKLYRKHKMGRKTARTALTVDDVRLIKRLLLDGLTNREVADKFERHIHTIRSIGKGNTWKHVEAA